MKILMIAPQPVLEPRGTPISVYHRLLGLSALHHQVDLVTYHLGRDVEIPGVEICRIPALPMVREVKIGPSWLKPILDLLVLWKALLLLLTRRYDVIHAHEEAAFFGVVLARLFGVRHVYDMHSVLSRQLGAFGFAEKSPVRRLFVALEWWTLQTTDVVITISPELQAYVIGVNPNVRQAMIENLPVQGVCNGAGNGTLTALKQLIKREQRYPIVYTGTFEPYQGLEILFRSAELVSQCHPEALFLLVGGKPNQVRQWQAEAQRRNLERHVAFAGTVPVDEVGAFMDLARILVSPRIRGLSVPLKVYSYMLAGKPIVATDIEAHSLVLDRDMAQLVPCTGEAFAEGIMALMDAPAHAVALGRRAREAAQERFHMADYQEKLAKVYSSLLSPAPKRGGVVGRRHVHPSS